MEKNPEVSIILPCRNEEKSIGNCIKSIKYTLKKYKIKGEIIVSDSSQDKSPIIAKKLGAKLIKHDKKGYGIACLEGFKIAKGKYIFFADSDGSYDFIEIPRFVKYLNKGYDFVIGNRFKGKMGKGAMPLSHKYIGNPFLSFIFKIFFRTKIYDIHCGMRAIKKSSLKKLDLKTTGMEFASEMIIKAVNENLKIKELPICYNKRLGKSKLHSFSDGWRHLRFMLMYAPTYLFLIPGLILFIIGIMITILFLLGPVKIFGITFYDRPIILGSFFIILGYQIIILDIYAKTYMKSTGFIKSDKMIDFIARFVTFESGVLIGIIILLVSLFIATIFTLDWIFKGFPQLDNNIMLLVLTLAIVGVQTIFSAFLLSILLVEKK